MVEDIIAVISYNSKNYVIYKENGSIKYALLSDGKINDNIDEKDIEIANDFYNLLCFNNKTSVFCGIFKINKEDYEIYRDLRSGLYTFILKKDGKRYVPSKENIVFLNSYFNDEQFVYSQNKHKIYRCNRAKKEKKIKHIKKILKTNGMIAVALISSSLITYNLPQNLKSNLDYEMGKSIRVDITSKDKSYTFDDIAQAIDSNKNFSEEEKIFIKDLMEKEFEENKEYMDIEKIVKRLKTLDVQYDKYYKYNKRLGKYEVAHTGDMTYDCAAYYNIVNNRMTCIEPKYDVSKVEEKSDEIFDFNEVDKSTYYHELNHMFSNYDVDSSLSLLAESMAFFEVNDYIKTNTGVYEAVSDDIQKNYRTEIFRETLNEIFSQEYVDPYFRKTYDKKREIGYSNHLPYMYCLVEILPEEVLREYKFNDNDSIITEGLLNISDNKEEAYKLVTAMKSLNLYDGMVLRAENMDLLDEQEKLEAINQAKLEQEENYKRVHDGLGYFYKERYNRDMSDDMNMLIYLYNTPIITDAEKAKVQEVLNVSEKNQIVRFDIKGYFSKEYKENHPNIIVYYEDKNTFAVRKTIYEEIRYLDKDNDYER